MESIRIGATVRDKATGYEGKVTARAEYDTGYVSFLVESLVEGRPVSGWYEATRLEIAEE